MRRLKTPLALAVTLGLIFSSNILFAQTETTSPISPQTEASATQPDETSTAVNKPADTKPAATKPATNDTKATLPAGEPTSDHQQLLAGPQAATADNTAAETKKPAAARDQTVQPPAASNAQPGRFALSFDDLKFDMENTEAFDRDLLTPKINSYHGGKVKIRGYIRPNFKQSGITKFIFVRDNKECCFGPQAAIFDNILVRLERGQSTNYTVRPVTIEGDFVLKEYHGDDGNVWSLYRMYNAKIK